MLKINSKCKCLTFLAEKERSKNIRMIAVKKKSFSILQKTSESEMETATKNSWDDVLFHMCINLQYPMKTANYRMNFIASRLEASRWNQQTIPYTHIVSISCLQIIQNGFVYGLASQTFVAHFFIVQVDNLDNVLYTHAHST